VLASACVIDELEETDVGDEPYCEGAARWPTDDARHERALVALVDNVRRAGIECGDMRRNPVAEVIESPELHCAARLHATYVAEHSAVHEGYDHSTPLSRANLAGYDGVPRFELLARNQGTARAVLDAWLGEPKHCAAVMDRDALEIGVGHSHADGGDATGWVVVLGEPRD
jgi:uncharacterized protein YkwD